MSIETKIDRTIQFYDESIQNSTEMFNEEQKQAIIKMDANNISAAFANIGMRTLIIFYFRFQV